MQLNISFLDENFDVLISVTMFAMRIFIFVPNKTEKIFANVS